MKIMTVDPHTALTLSWVRTLVADWVESSSKTTAPEVAANALAGRAAEFFRTDFLRLAATVDNVDSDSAAAGVPLVAAVFCPMELRGATDHVIRWADIFSVPISKQAIACLVEQMGQHFAGVMLDVLATSSQPGVESAAAIRELLRRLVPASSSVSD